VAILADISVTIGEGEFLCLLGPSGCGKTTLLRLLAGLDRPSSGCIRLRGQAITAPSIQRGVVFQDYSLFPWMPLHENVSLAIHKANPGLSRPERKALAEEYLSMVGLGDSTRKYPFELSGGMQQRGAIARALAMGSPVLLMDEPFGALDLVNRARLQDLLTSIWAESSPKRTVVFVTHDVDEALLLAGRIVVLGACPGRVIADMEVPLERPRLRKSLTGSRDFHELRERLGDLLRSDAIRQLDAQEQVAGQGDGV
jgi:NitT/TauT family transport system ATP-binding protein